MGIAEYTDLDATAMAQLVRDGELTAAELLEEAIRGLDAVDPRLNVAVHRMYDQARSQSRALSASSADAPFHGVPFLLKDLLATLEGEPMRSGSRGTQSIVSAGDSELVRRFKRSGVVMFAKTNTPEFGLAPVTEPEAFGPARNPWDPDKTPSGSSGGSAAAVAARVVPMAHANDGGGSIRTPASCCGLFGLKPSRGRVPTGPVHGDLWLGSVIEHVVTRSVRDSARMLDAIHGPDVGAPYVAAPPARPYAEEAGRDPAKLKVALCRRPLIGTDLHPDCNTAMERTRLLLESLGHQVEERVLPFDREAFIHAFVTVVTAETAVELEEVGELRGRALSRRDVETATWLFGQIGRTLSAADLSRARRHLDHVAREISRFMANEEFDTILTPTLGKPPVEIGALAPSVAERMLLETLVRTKRGPKAVLRLELVEPLVRKVFDFSAFTAPFNTTGHPAMSIPLHWNDAGLPIGSHFVGRHGDESTLFALAGQLERAQPWAQRRPPICA